MDEKENFLGSAGGDQMPQRIPEFLNKSPCKPLRSLIVPKKKMVYANLRNCMLIVQKVAVLIYLYTVSSIQCDGHKELWGKIIIQGNIYVVKKRTKPAVYN